MPASKSSPLLLDEQDLQIDENEVVQTRFMRVEDAVKFQASGNPKLHQLPALAAAFIRDGFTDPPKWDVNLNDGKGGFVYGNGRLEALAWLEVLAKEGESFQFNGQDIEAVKPRGIATDKAGAWVAPIKYGLDADDSGGH